MQNVLHTEVFAKRERSFGRKVYLGGIGTGNIADYRDSRDAL